MVFALFGGFSPVIVILISKVSVTVISVVSIIVLIQVSEIEIMATFDVSMQLPEVVITLIG